MSQWTQLDPIPAKNSKHICSYMNLNIPYVRRDITEFPYSKFDLNELEFQICFGQNGICRQESAIYLEYIWNSIYNVDITGFPV